MVGGGGVSSLITGVGEVGNEQLGASGYGDEHVEADDGDVELMTTATRLNNLGRGRAPFVRHAFEAHSLKEQGYELQAVTTDGDKDGNQFVVTITLSANSKAVLKAAEPAYLAILSKY